MAFEPEGRRGGPLVAVEAEHAWYVTWRGDRDDWLIEYEKAPGVDAGGWARNLVRTFNARAEAGGVATPAPVAAGWRLL